MDTKKRKYGLSDKGLSLIELVTVVAIIAVLSGISLPLFNKWLPNIRLRSASQDLYGYMQKARLGAVKSNNTWAIVFNETANTYTMRSDYYGDNDNNGTVSLIGYKSGVQYGHGDAPNPTSLVTYNPPVSAATFTPLGTGNGGYVYLEHEKSTTAYRVGSLNTGAIKIEKWMSGGWK